MADDGASQPDPIIPAEEKQKIQVKVNPAVWILGGAIILSILGGLAFWYGSHNRPFLPTLPTTTPALSNIASPSPATTTAPARPTPSPSPRPTPTIKPSPSPSPSPSPIPSPSSSPTPVASPSPSPSPSPTP